MIPKALPEQIEGERVCLRRITMADAKPFYDFVHDDENVQYMFFTDEQRSKEGATSMVEWVVNAYDTGESICIYAIADVETGEYMGNLGAQTMEGTDDTEFFYSLLPQFRGQGYVTEAVRLFLRFLFDEGIQMAVAIIIPENKTSIQVVERLKARFAGDCLIHGNQGLRYEIDQAIVQEWA